MAVNTETNPINHILEKKALMDSPVSAASETLTSKLVSREEYRMPAFAPMISHYFCNRYFEKTITMSPNSMFIAQYLAHSKQIRIIAVYPPKTPDLSTQAEDAEQFYSLWDIQNEQCPLKSSDRIEELIWSYGEKPVLFVRTITPHPDVQDYRLGARLWVINPETKKVKEIIGGGEGLPDFTYLDELSPKYPNAALISSYYSPNSLDKNVHEFQDVFQYDIAKEGWAQHPNGLEGHFIFYLVKAPNTSFEHIEYDEDLKPIFATKIIPDEVDATLKCLEIFKCLGVVDCEMHFEQIFSAKYQEPTKVSFLDISKNKRTIYLLDNRNHNFAVVKALDVETGDISTKIKLPDADVTDIVLSKEHDEIAAYFTEVEKPGIHLCLDAKDIKLLNRIQFFKAILDKLDLSYPFDCTLSDKSMVISDPDAPHQFMLVDFDALHLDKPLGDKFFPRKRFCFDSMLPRSVFEQHARTESRIFKSRDGLDLVAYITRPKQATPIFAPFVVMIHGGPRARDYLMHNNLAALLANRGVGTLSINFRGSSGFGKSFCLKGNGAWGKEMIDDIEDVVLTLQKEGVIDPKRTMAAGFSYGGNAVYSLLAFKPGLFMAAIAGAGDVDLEKEVARLARKTPRDEHGVSIADYWSTLMVGQPYFHFESDAQTYNVIEKLAERSPIHKVADIHVPLLIISPADDQAVSYEQTQLMVEALSAKSDAPVTALKIWGEGHLMHKPENIGALFAIIESFVGQIFNLRVEPIGRELICADDLEVIHGLDRLKELEVAFKRTEEEVAQTLRPLIMGQLSGDPKPTQCVLDYAMDYMYRAHGKKTTPQVSKPAPRPELDLSQI